MDTETKTKPLIVDCHMHTTLCGHAVGEPLDYARSAAARGIGLIIFTCHIPMEWEAFGQAGIRMRESQLPRYMDWISETREAAAGFGVKVLTGIEAEVFPDERELVAMDKILASHSFDMVLGSLHHQCASFGIWLEREGLVDDPEIIRAYFRELGRGALTKRYDTLAHPDLIRIYGTVEPFDPVDYEPSIREFLQNVKEAGCCLELNTSGLTKGVYEMHPAPVILDWAAEMGIPLTIGSDSHRPESVGQFFGTVLPLLREKGFRELNYFEGRHRMTIPIPEKGDLPPELRDSRADHQGGI